MESVVAECRLEYCKIYGIKAGTIMEEAALAEI